MSAAFRQLLRKDLVHAWPTVLTILALFTGFVLYYASRGDAATAMFALAMMLIPGPLVMLAIFIWRSFALHEWQSKHMYFLLSLPTPGWYVLGSRILLVVAEFLCYTTAFFIGLGVLLSTQGPVLLVDGSAADWRDWISLIARGAFLALLFGTILAVVAQFSFLAGRSLRRGSFPVAAFLYVAGLWLLFRIASGVSTLIGTSLDLQIWIPVPNPAGGVFGAAFVNLLPLLIAFGLSSIFFALSTRIFERWIEV